MMPANRPPEIAQEPFRAARMGYSLTEHGKSLNAALGPLGEWGSERIARIGAEMVAHDQPDDARSPA
jgi:DNA-binding HxlR family transcriptional regulator